MLRPVLAGVVLVSVAVAWVPGASATIYRVPSALARRIGNASEATRRRPTPFRGSGRCGRRAWKRAEAGGAVRCAGPVSGHYDAQTGSFLTPAGQPRCYYASDNLEAERYRGLTPSDLVDIAALNGLHFNGACQEGVTFHLIGALSEFGKLGVLCIGSSHDRAEALYRRTVEILDRESCASESDLWQR